MTNDLSVLSAAESAFGKLRAHLYRAPAYHVEQNTNQQVFEFLVADFEASFADNTTPLAAEARKIIDGYNANRESLSNSDIYKLDMLMLRMQEPESLIQRAETLRTKYLSLAGPELAARYRQPTLPPLDRFNDGARKLLLADAQNLLRFTHASYFLTPLREEKRKSILRKGSTVMFFCSLIWLATTLACIHILNSPTLALMATVVYAGLMGGFISSQRRVQMIPSDGDPLASITALENGEHLYWFAPATGAVFAVVLWLLFVSGVISGKVFPTFRKELNPVSTMSSSEAMFRSSSAQMQTATVGATPENNVPNSTVVTPSATSPGQSQNDKADAMDKGRLESIVKNLRAKATRFEESGEFERMFLSHNNPFLPIDGASYALLLLWSFIAGFAERFVPDALDKVINSAPNKTPTPQAAPPLRPARIDADLVVPAAAAEATGQQQAKAAENATKAKAPVSGSVTIEIKDSKDSAPKRNGP